MAFQNDYPVVLAHEVGSVDNPADPGGRTKDGVTQRTYDDWRTRQGLPTRDVYQMDDGEREAIYLEFYNGQGAASSIDTPPTDLAEPLALIHFDSAFHSGAKANGWLTDSGGDPVQYLALRGAFLNSWVAANPNRTQFAHGFANRLADLAAYVTSPSGAAASGGALLLVAVLAWLLVKHRKASGT